MKKHLSPCLTGRSALPCWLRLAAIILLVPSCVASAVTLSSYGYSTLNYTDAFNYSSKTIQYVKWTKISLLSSPSQEDTDKSQPALSQKVKADNISLQITNLNVLRFSGLDVQNTSEYTLGLSPVFNLSLRLTNNTDASISVYPGVVIYYINYFYLHYTTSLGGAQITLPPRTTCSVNVVPSIYVTMKTNESSLVSAKIASDMKQGKLKLSPDHIQGGEGVLVNSSGLAGPTYSFPDATLDAGNQSWQWVPVTEGENLNIVFPSVHNRGIAAGEYKGILTTTLSCR